MDFDWTEDQQAFRRRIEDFLRVNLPADWEAFSKHGPASPALTAFARTFCRQLADEGMLFPHWPKEFGGEGLGPREEQILAEGRWEYGEPRGGQDMNLNWIGPTLMKYGTAEQKAKYLPQISSGEMLWCQGFSEPDSGSDLASLRTRAVLEGDHYRVNGQKIWTSYAGLADTCFLLTRTSDDKKRGITILLSLTNERLGIPRYHLARAALDRAVATLKEAGDFTREGVRGEAARCAALC